jgi:hypothetical protein
MSRCVLRLRVLTLPHLSLLITYATPHSQNTITHATITFCFPSHQWTWT